MLLRIFTTRLLVVTKTVKLKLADSPGGRGQVAYKWKRLGIVN